MLKDNVSKQLSTSYRQSVERNIEQLLEEKLSKEPTAKKPKLDTDVDLNAIYCQVCVCNALLAATDEQPIAHHHLKLLKDGNDSNYQFLCEVNKFIHQYCIILALLAHNLVIILCV